MILLTFMSIKLEAAYNIVLLRYIYIDDYKRDGPCYTVHDCTALKSRRKMKRTNSHNPS